MKTKKESKSSLGRSSGPWRSIEKGEKNALPKQQAEEHPKFLIGPYVRLSPTGDEREEGSLVSHPQRIKQFIESKNLQYGGAWGEVVDWYVDKDLSGKDMNRPSFQRLLADIKSGRINAVIVTELSRLNRKVKDFCDVWEFFKDHNVALFSLKENFDTSTPMGELMLIQAMSFAQFERQTIVDRIKKGARARAERGLANGGILLGFKPVPHKPNHRDIDENEKPYVEFIFRKFLEMKNISSLIHFLNENGYRTKEFINQSGKKVGGHRWTLSTTHSLLTNRAYIGEREVNKKNRSVSQENLKEDERYFVVGAHWPALISKELFFDVQNLLETNKKRARKYVHEYRLTGLIECAECGAKLVGKSGSGKNGKYHYYGHKRKMVVKNDRHLERCHNENVPALKLEEAVISKLKDLSSDRDLVLELARVAANSSREKSEHQKSLLASKEQERRKLEQKLDNLYDAISEESDKSLRLGLSQRAREAQAQMDQLIIAIDEIKCDYEQSNNVVDISSVMELLKVFREKAFDKLPAANQSEILAGRIRRLVVHQGKVFVEIYGRKPELIYTQDESVSGTSSLSESTRTTLSGVRTAFKLVRPEGVEPPTT